MCHNIRKISETNNGLLLKCTDCDIYQLVFNNLNFNFTSNELTGFKSYLEEIDEDFWEEEYKHSIYDKKIPIPTLQTNFIILFDKRELQELRTLLRMEQVAYRNLAFDEIRYALYMN